MRSTITNYSRLILLIFIFIFCLSGCSKQNINTEITKVTNSSVSQTEEPTPQPTQIDPKVNIDDLLLARSPYGKFLLLKRTDNNSTLKEFFTNIEILLYNDSNFTSRTNVNTLQSDNNSFYCFNTKYNLVNFEEYISLEEKNKIDTLSELKRLYMKLNNIHDLDSNDTEDSISELNIDLSKIITLKSYSNEIIFLNYVPNANETTEYFTNTRLKLYTNSKCDTLLQSDDLIPGKKLYFNGKYYTSVDITQYLDLNNVFDNHTSYTDLVNAYFKANKLDYTPKTSQIKVVNKDTDKYVKVENLIVLEGNNKSLHFVEYDENTNTAKDIFTNCTVPFLFQDKEVDLFEVIGGKNIFYNGTKCVSTNILNYINPNDIEDGYVLVEKLHEVYTKTNERFLITSTISTDEYENEDYSEISLDCLIVLEDSNNNIIFVQTQDNSNFATDIINGNEITFFTNNKQTETINAREVIGGKRVYYEKHIYHSVNIFKYIDVNSIKDHSITMHELLIANKRANN